MNTFALFFSFFFRESKRLSIIFLKQTKALFVVMLLFFVQCLSAQETLVVGQVFNKYDRTPLESVSIFFKGSNVHTQTNEEGYFLIRNQGNESVLVFSLIGYVKEEIKVKPGESVGLEMLLEEKENMLGELFVKPGANPANDLMKNVRENRKKNNVRTNLKSNEQSVVFLSKNDSRWENNRIFEHFKTGNLSPSDSSLLVPLYMEESVYNQTDNKKEQISRNTFNTSETAQKTITGLLKGMGTDLNFYNNSISVLGKTMISPLASIGKTYYRYYLTDSTKTDAGKEYLLSFRTKNTKNLAFNGEMRIDSATYGLTYIKAELPKQANLNYIHNLQIDQKFNPYQNYWIPYSEKSAWDITYELLKENTVKSPELLVRRSSIYQPDGDEIRIQTDTFANSDYTSTQLEAKMTAMQQSSLYKTARYLADVLLTGYFRVGIIDIGQIIDITRLTKIEGVRVGLPFRTNEHLWKNLMLGGHAAYGFRDKEMKYSGEVQWKLPVQSSRIILGVKYLNDYRRIDYDYNNFLWREDPLATGDENFVSTFFDFRAQNRMSKRHEMSAFLFNDWTPDIESKWIFRDVTYFPNELLPMIQNESSFNSLHDRNFSFTTRFSFGEKTIEDHFQRLYLKSEKPVLYATLEGGHFKYGDEKGNYGRVSTTLLHRGQFALGEWRAMIEAGKILGSVPYPLLKFIQGKESGAYNRFDGAYNRFEFAMMNNREYIADTYGTLFTELITNGIIFNNILLIKHLNLREIASFKMAYGTLSDSHAERMNIPSPSARFTQPYSEASIGFCNLFGVLSIQSIWRLSDLNKTNIQKWGIKLNVMVTF